MENRDLRLFKHLASTLHFGQTSRACHVTPSALTRIIQRLEEELGEKLFLRDNRSVTLTVAGKMFRSYADDVLQRFEILQGDLAKEDVLGGEVSVYCSVTAAYSILPAVIQKFRTLHPQVHITLQTGDAALALTRLQNRDVDITVAALPKRLPERVEFLKIVETPLVFITPSAFPETIQWKGQAIDWQQTPLIMANFGLSRERTDKWFRKKNISPNVYAEVAGNEAIIAMVALGCGVGVVPGLVLEKSPLKEQIDIVAVEPELESFSIGLCTMKRNMQRPQVDAFWKVAATVSQDDEERNV